MGVKGLGGETAGMKSLELKHLELNSHVAPVKVLEISAFSENQISFRLARVSIFSE